jgi:hypothetical protein
MNVEAVRATSGPPLSRNDGPAPMTASAVATRSALIRPIFDDAHHHRSSKVLKLNEAQKADHKGG